MSTRPLSLFAGYGIELEYMIVDLESCDIRPVADRILAREAGRTVNSLERGELAWSNELVLHVLELKTNGPAASLRGLAEHFHADIQYINACLGDLGACLMPAAMHPWMDPDRETVLWPHGDREIYSAYNRVFDCRGHGWSNLQSMHINLPFRGDDEFRRLHAAIRVLLPILPAIAASSPLLGGEFTGFMDTRLETYRHNADRIPAVTGRVIPENIRSRREYETAILAPMYAAIAPLDPDGILQHEWLNSRGAIPRFERDAIEIRVLDTQESPSRDLALAGVIVAVLRELVDGRWCDPVQLERFATEPLAELFLAVIRDAEDTVIRAREFLRLFGFPDRHASAADLWRYLAEELPLEESGGGWRDELAFILEQGCLARRLVRAVGPDARRPRLAETCRVLCRCLQRDERFEGV